MVRTCRWDPLPVADVAALLAPCPSRWWLSGGWAVDHWLGATTRDHGDIDVSTGRSDLPAVLGLLPPHLRPFAAVRGGLSPLAGRADDPELHNIWLLDRDRWVLQINLEDGDDSTWRYRRDPRIGLPWERAVAIVGSVPTGTPATQLLWKSRGPRSRDEHDLDALHGVLTAAERRWLLAAVRSAHPDSPWADDPRLLAR